MYFGGSVRRTKKLFENNIAFGTQCFNCSYLEFVLIVRISPPPKKNHQPCSVVGLVWSHNPESYTGRSLGFWQVLPSQAGQRVGSRQIDDWIAGSRVRECSQVDKSWCILAVSYCCSEENTAIVGWCCIHQLSNQQPKKISEVIQPVSEWVSEWASEWELLILQKLLKISVLFFIIYVFPSRFSLSPKITVYKYSQRCEKNSKHAKTCFLFEQQNLNNKKTQQNVPLFLYWICFI